MKYLKSTLGRAMVIGALALLVMAALTPRALAAGEQTLDISAGSIVITATGYSQGGAPEIAHAGGYVIGGASTKDTVRVVSGTHAIVMNGLSIEIPPTTASAATEMPTICAFAVESGANASVTLQGANKLTSAAGCAGLYVQSGASLTIDGAGSLDARGGAGRPASGSPYYGGGAGLGGNGYISSVSFGSIVINGGNITAVGGVTSTSVVYGAGAGLGSGGAMSNSSAYPSPEGSITINGGKIRAQGGECVNISDTCGGAGIGSGGTNGEEASYVTIAIHGGEVNAQGNNDGAGIGAGANYHCAGTILIDGGEVIARGGDERDGSSWGGAGIGGGDMGAVSRILIGGSAKVAAYGGGAASGIGGGNNGSVWDVEADAVGEITISGNADVTAFGGSSGMMRGGAGIGAGRTGYPSSFLCNSGVITVKDKASVAAYAGANAQAMGVGSGYDYSRAVEGEDVLRIDSTISLRLFNQDAVQAAYAPIVEGSGAPMLVAFTLADSALGAFPDAGELTDATRGSGFSWTYSGVSGQYDLAVYDPAGQVSYFRSAHTAFGNWAVLIAAAAPEPALYTLTVENGSGDGQYAADTRVPVAADTAPAGMYFSHWETHSGGAFEDENAASTVFIMPANDVTIVAVYRGVNPPTGDTGAWEPWRMGTLILALGALGPLLKKRPSLR